MPSGWSFHYTPKHGSWLNLAEIEFSVLSRCCLRQRLPDEETLEREIQTLGRERNAVQSVINWRFNTPDARTKLHRLYPFDSKTDASSGDTSDSSQGNATFGTAYHPARPSEVGSEWTRTHYLGLTRTLVQNQPTFRYYKCIRAVLNVLLR